MDVGKVHSFRKVLSEQAVGIFIGTTLPRALGITEVNLDVRGQAEAWVVGHLLATIPGQRFVELTR